MYDSVKDKVKGGEVLKVRQRKEREMHNRAEEWIGSVSS